MTTPNPIQPYALVSLESGKVFTPAYMEERAHYIENKPPIVWFWLSEQMTTKSKPDQRQKPYRTGYNYFRYSAETEEKASKVRGRISQLAAQLLQAKEELRALYPEE